MEQIRLKGDWGICPGDVVRTKKAHPCGGDTWYVVREGADVKMRCLTTVILHSRHQESHVFATAGFFKVAHVFRSNDFGSAFLNHFSEFFIRVQREGLTDLHDIIFDIKRFSVGFDRATNLRIDIVTKFIG